MQPEVAELHSLLVPQLAGLARNMVRDLDPQVGYSVIVYITTNAQFELQCLFSCTLCK